MRENLEQQLIEVFSGVADLLDRVKLPVDLVAWSHGVFYTQQQKPERIPGKLPLSDTTAPGRILSLTQLDLRHRNAMVYHTLTQYVVETDLTALEKEEATSSPMEPFIP